MAVNPSKLFRLKPVRSTISASSLRRASAIDPQISASQISKSSISIGKQLDDIQKSLDNILRALTEQNKTERKRVEEERKRKERERRSVTEEGLEKKFSKVETIAKTILSPVKSILERIIDFFLTVFVGRAIIKLIDWFADPQNKGKVNTIIRFLKDTWPALLGAYFLFGTTLGKFVRSIAGILTKGIVQLALRNPVVATGVVAGAALGAGVIGEYNRIQGLIEKEAKREGKSVDQKVKEIEKSKGLLSYIGDAFNYSGPVSIQGFAGGGSVKSLERARKFWEGPGQVSGEKGVDKIPANLSDGEFVFSKSAVDYWGPEKLAMMNQMGGGNNRPKIYGGKTYAAGGGLIGRMLNTGFSSNYFGGGVRGFARGTRATAGFTGMARRGFEAVTRGESFKASKRLFQILGRGAYSAPTMEGASRYAKSASSVGMRQSPGGVVKTIVPGGARRLSMIEPQSKVPGPVFDRGRVLAERLMSGYRQNSALANRLRGQLSSGYVSRSLTPAASIGRFVGGALNIMNAPVIGDMIFPQASGSRGSLETLEGARSAGLLDRYNTNRNVSSGITPPVSSMPKVVVLPSPKISSGASPASPASQNIPAFNAVHPEGNRRTAQILGVN